MNKLSYHFRASAGFALVAVFCLAAHLLQLSLVVAAFAGVLALAARHDCINLYRDAVRTPVQAASLYCLGTARTACLGTAQTCIAMQWEHPYRLPTCTA